MKAFLEGENIYLRALCLDDATQEYTDWFNDATICQYNSHHRFPNTIEKTKSYINASAESSLVLAICDKKSNKHLGNISLQNLNFIDSQAEFAILVGEGNQHAKGVGTEAGKLIVEHGFNALGLHRIYCGTSMENIPMQKLAVKLGFNQEGVSKDALFKNGRYVDIVHYGLINSKN